MIYLINLLLLYLESSILEVEWITKTKLMILLHIIKNN